MNRIVLVSTLCESTYYFQGGVGPDLDEPTLAPDWGARFTTTLMFPKR